MSTYECSKWAKCTLVMVPKSHLSRAHEVWPWLMSHEEFLLSRVWRMRVQPSSLITLLQFPSLEIDGIWSGKKVGQFYCLFSRFSGVTACHLVELPWFGFYNIHKKCNHTRPGSACGLAPHPFPFILSI